MTAESPYTEKEREDYMIGEEIEYHEEQAVRNAYGFENIKKLLGGDK